MSPSEPNSPALRPDAAPENAGFDKVVMDQLNDADARKLLDTIDAIRDLQVGEIVDLPQVIVVGAQSAGKSSVLEAISRVQFPVNAKKCTRFATELVLRRSAQTKVSVAIKWADKDSQEPLSQTRFDKNALPEMISEAEEMMGFTESSSKQFSKDVLRIEIAGPDVYPLTLVDLPGFYSWKTDEQPLDGMGIVEQLAKKYMEQKNSIILAVVAANGSPVSQTILGLAQEHDPDNKRTLGIITKPDQAPIGSTDEDSWFKILNGEDKTNRLTLGWHVLRNRAENEQNNSADMRDSKEAAFFKTRWVPVDDKYKGAEALRKRLSGVLLEHIRRSLPNVVSDIEASLRGREERLERMGTKPRETIEDMRSYMFEIADRFQRLAREGVEGRYVDPFFGGLYDDRFKIRARLRNLNRGFVAALSRKGAAFEIISEDDGNSSEPELDSDESMPEFLRPFLDKFSGFPDPQRITEGGLCQKIDRVASINSGTEFPGSPNSDLVLRLFRTQAKPWQKIASFHLELVSKLARYYVEELVSHIVGATDDSTVAAILGELVDPFFEAKAEALRLKLDELLRPYTTGLGLSLEAEFLSRLSKRRSARPTARYADHQDDEDSDEDNATRFRHRQSHKLSLVRGAEGLDDKDSFSTGILVDMMLTHYEMSIRTFTDTVINLAVENCLVCQIPDILTTRQVHRMDETALKELAQESEKIREERSRLVQETNLLREALKKCRQQRPRAPAVAAPANSDILGGAPETPSSSRQTPQPSNGESSLSSSPSAAGQSSSTGFTSLASSFLDSSRKSKAMRNKRIGNLPF